MRRVLWALLAAVLVVLAAPGAGASPANPQWDEWDFLNLVNRERWSRGLAPLAMVPGGREVARDWSGVMAGDGILRHNPDFAGQLGALVPSWRRAGENVGMGSGMLSLHNAFMNSPKHRDNVLGAWQYVGVGVRWNGPRLWVTVNFLAASSPVGWETRTPLTRVGGATEPDSSVLVSRRLPAGSAAAVVVARSDQFADALAGAPLASVHQGSVLLSPFASAPENVVEEARRVVAPGGRVFILGGPAALSGEVEDAFRRAGLVVERLAGPDRFATAALVAPRVNALPAAAFVVSGVAFPDALAASAVAGAQRAPILLVSPQGVPASTQVYLASHPQIRRIVVGGPAAVPDTVAKAVAVTQRVHGPDRYATAVNLANTFYPAANRVVLASGNSFADALVAAPEAARQGSPLVLTAPTPNDSSYGYIGTQSSRWTGATVVGNGNAIPDAAIQLLFS